MKSIMFAVLICFIVWGTSSSESKFTSFEISMTYLVSIMFYEVVYKGQSANKSKEK